MDREQLFQIEEEEAHIAEQDAHFCQLADDESDELAFAESGISLRWVEDLQRLRASRLDAIDRALEDMAGRNYGVCARCQGLIATERLREAPDTRVCAECAGRSAPVG